MFVYEVSVECVNGLQGMRVYITQRLEDNCQKLVLPFTLFGLILSCFYH